MAMLRYAENNPESYRRLVMHKLSPFRDIAKGVVVTMDWVPLTRHIVYAAASLGIPTILLPHESVFARESMYYVHPRFGINLPACDIILAWGDLQESIFVERGYPRERIIKLGAPKFDYISRIRGRGNRSAVRLLGLDPSKPVISFAAQPLDSQYDTQSARAAQSQAIVDTIAAASTLGAQVIVRTPPSKDKIFGADVYGAIAANPNVALDDANLYILTPEETIEVSDVVMSVNSTMLLEAALSGKVAITTKYLEFDQIWDKLRIPVVRNAGELKDVLSRGLTSPQPLLDRYDTAWAATAFSNGAFDGNAANRVREVLSEIADGRRDVHAGFALTQPFLPVVSSARAAE
ncbi:hypothetical protein [Sinorhizobium sp. BG8]|uniref:hypothetical protein n=1 Tax=Sinorhizobium sp. BG8 TaxID=2613773 RepID=UPI00193CC45C|nr:hypothetical protein [Sinorhizobium sp. BG8]